MAGALALEASARPASQGSVRSAFSAAEVLSAALVVLIGALVVALRVPILRAGEFDYDEGVYWESLRALQAGHPIFSSVFSSQPPAFLLLLEPPWAALGGSIAAARLVMLAFGVIAIVSGAVLGGRLLGRPGGVMVAALLALDPLMLRQSVVLQAEGPAVSLALLGMALAAVAVTSRRPRRASAAAGACGAVIATGVLTKLLDISVVPALVVLLAANPLQVPGRMRLGLLTALGAAIATAVFVAPLFTAWGEMWQQVVGLHLASRSLPLGQVSDPAFAAYAAREAPLMTIALVGSLIGWPRHRVAVLVGLAWVLGAFASMAATHPLWPRHLVSTVPGMALLGGVCLSRLWTWVSRNGPRASIPVGAAAAIAFGALLAGGIANAPQGSTQWSLVEALEEQTSPGALVLSDDQFAAAAAGRNVPPEFVDTSFVRIQSTGLTLTDIATVITDEHVCAVAFATGRLAGVPGLAAWVSTHYPRLIEPSPDQWLYVRPGC